MADDISNMCDGIALNSSALRTDGIDDRDLADCGISFFKNISKEKNYDDGIYRFVELSEPRGPGRTRGPRKALLSSAWRRHWGDGRPAVCTEIGNRPAR